MNKITVPLLAVCGLAIGCMSERELLPDQSERLSQDDPRARLLADEAPVSDEYRPLVGQLPVQNGQLDGAIGYVSGLDPDSAYETSGWGEPHYASVYTVGHGSNGAAMTVVEVEGGLNHAALKPGAHLEYNIYDTAGESGSLFAYVVGCAGPEANEWEFDQVADETILDVSESSKDPNVLIIDYEARFTDWETGAPSNVIGTFEVLRTPN